MQNKTDRGSNTSPTLELEGDAADDVTAETTPPRSLEERETEDNKMKRELELVKKDMELKKREKDLRKREEKLMKLKSEINEASEVSNVNPICQSTKVSILCVILCFHYLS